jgi:adenylate kinase family enzyme
MNRIVIFGNSGSGKSLLAGEKARALACPHLDLDTVAWKDDAETPIRLPAAESGKKIAPFLAENDDWVIEGCYSDLLELVLPRATEIIFLNPGIATCIANARNRPWEPHKYDSPEAQDANLEMLVTWIADYQQREDEFSLSAHRKLFDDFKGTRTEYRSNARP